METFVYADLKRETDVRAHRRVDASTRHGRLGWYPGVLAVLMLALSVFLFSGPLLRLLDPVAAVVDIGALSLVLLGLLAGLCFVTVSRWLLGLLWPVFREFNQHHFEPIFKSLRPWQKIVIYLSCYFLLLSVFVACLWAVC